MPTLTVFGRTVPLDVIWRHTKTVFVTLSIMWASIVYIGGDFMEVKADEALARMLKRQGMSPDDFKKMQAQIEDINRDVGNVGTQIQSLTKRSDTIQVQNNRIEAQVDNLVQALIAPRPHQ